MFQFEMHFARRQAKEARESIPTAHGDRAKAEWLTMARMWERLADEYEKLQSLRVAD